MTRRFKWIAAVSTGVTAVVVLALWFSVELSKCSYHESDPAYSPDRRFYSQMQFTICRDHAKSRVRLIVGATGKSDKNVVLDMGPEIGTVDVSWHEGPELHVRVAESRISKRYGPYEDFPRVVVENP